MDNLKHISQIHCAWADKALLAEQGILVGCDITQEWLLPWWWDHYCQANRYPVAFVDFGMTQEAKEWCSERGTLLFLRLGDCFVAEKKDISPDNVLSWENAYGSKLWNNRHGWFKKPFACLLAPFRNTLWIDLDCEVRGSLEGAFALAKDYSGISCAKESNDILCKDGFNSGVVLFKRGLDLIKTWAQEALLSNHQFAGDQDILCALIRKDCIPVAELPLIYNWSRCNPDNPDAVILHWHGQYGKDVIAHQIAAKKWEQFG